MGPLPTFLIVGAGKSGTSALAHFVAQHPDVLMSSPKEPRFFQTSEYSRGAPYYSSKYFSGFAGQRAVGEAANKLYPSFLAKRVHSTLPDAKLLCIIREPVDRAYAHWWMNVTNGTEHLPFLEAIEDNLRFADKDPSAEEWEEYLRQRDRGDLPFRVYLELGYYAQQLESYFQLFPRDRIKIVFSQELQKDPVGVTQDIWRYLGVNPDCPVPDPTPQNVAGDRTWRRPLTRVLRHPLTTQVRKTLPKPLRNYGRDMLSVRVSRPKLDPSLRRRLISHYAEHNSRLQDLLNTALRGWGTD